MQTGHQSSPPLGPPHRLVDRTHLPYLRNDCLSGGQDEGFGVSVEYNQETGKPAFRFRQKAQNHRQTGKPDFLISNFQKITGKPANRIAGFSKNLKIPGKPAD